MSVPGWAGDSNAHTAKWQEARTHAQPAPNCTLGTTVPPTAAQWHKAPNPHPKRHSCSAPALKYRSPHRRWLSSLGSMGASYTCGR
jgi:hypothetical protein